MSTSADHPNLVNFLRVKDSLINLLKQLKGKPNDRQKINGVSPLIGYKG